MSYTLKRRSRGSGFHSEGIAGENLGSKKLVYLTDAGEWRLADSEAVATMPVLGITKESIGSGKGGSIHRYGYIGRSDWTFTVGGAVYASETAGELTQTEPTLTSNVVQPVAYAETETLIFFNPWTWRGLGSPTFTKRLHVGVEAIRVPAAAAPDVVVQDNTVMLSFNQNDTESSYFSWEVPADYAGGDLNLYAHWTNDGGGDDNGKNVLWEVNYQSIANTLVVSGSHANSPKIVADTYTSAAGWILHTTGMMTIAEADFSTRHMLEFRLTALAAAPTQLTGESHLVAMMVEYTAYSDLG